MDVGGASSRPKHSSQKAKAEKKLKDNCCIPRCMLGLRTPWSFGTSATKKTQSLDTGLVPQCNRAVPWQMTTSALKRDPDLSWDS